MKFNFKIILLGNTDTGKSSIVRRFTEDDFSLDNNCHTTVGIDLRFRTIKLEGDLCQLEIWDTAGQERFHSIPSTYFRKAKAILVVYDITDCDSFRSVERWLKMVEEYAENDALVYLIDLCRVMCILGNKCDKERKRTISRRTGEQYAQLKNVEFVETSVKTADNVEEMFTRIAAKLRSEKLKLRRLSSSDICLSKIKLELEDSPKTQPSRCCIFRKINGSS